MGVGETLAALRDTKERRGWHHAVVFATLAALAGAEPTDALAVYLHQAALGVISAGVRAIPIGHTHGQQVLARLHDDLRDLAGGTGRAATWTPPAASAPPTRCFAMHKRHLYTRLFRS